MPENNLQPCRASFRIPLLILTVCGLAGFVLDYLREVARPHRYESKMQMRFVPRDSEKGLNEDWIHDQQALIGSFEVLAKASAILRRDVLKDESMAVISALSAGLRTEPHRDAATGTTSKSVLDLSIRCRHPEDAREVLFAVYSGYKESVSIEQDRRQEENLQGVVRATEHLGMKVKEIEDKIAQLRVKQRQNTGESREELQKGIDAANRRVRFLNHQVELRDTIIKNWAEGSTVETAPLESMEAAYLRILGVVDDKAISATGLDGRLRSVSGGKDPTPEAARQFSKACLRLLEREKGREAEERGTLQTAIEQQRALLANLEGFEAEHRAAVSLRDRISAQLNVLRDRRSKVEIERNSPWPVETILITPPEVGTRIIPSVLSCAYRGGLSGFAVGFATLLLIYLLGFWPGKVVPTSPR